MTGTFAPHDQQVAVPAPGQLATVRHRRWVAADVSRGEVASSDPHMFTGRVPHLVTLASTEDVATAPFGLCIEIPALVAARS